MQDASAGSGEPATNSPKLVLWTWEAFLAATHIIDLDGDSDSDIDGDHSTTNFSHDPPSTAEQFDAAMNVFNNLDETDVFINNMFNMFDTCVENSKSMGA